MHHIAAYIELMRPKHYLKNVLVCLPVVFAGELFVPALALRALLAFVAFSLAASTVYILNDLVF